MSLKEEKHIVCPDCGARGRKLGEKTLRAQLLPELTGTESSLEHYHFCATAQCSVVYFTGSTHRNFHAGDLKLPVFQKSADGQRFACYCFEHTVKSLQDEVQREGSSRIPDEIKAKCRLGLDTCDLKNPQGVCCLGNVRAVVKHAMAESRGKSMESLQSEKRAEDCCSAENRTVACPSGEEHR